MSHDIDRRFQIIDIPNGKLFDLNLIKLNQIERERFFIFETSGYGYYVQ